MPPLSAWFGGHVFRVEWSPGMLVFKVDGVETHRTTTDVPDSPMFLIRRLGAVRRLDGGAIEAATRFRLADRPKDFELLHDANTIYFRRGFYFRHRLARRPDRARMRRSALGIFRVGEDGRLYLISKSEHYHTPLGHGFPGYTLLDCARQLGIPNATHNNTRGQITRLLEEELVAAVNGGPACTLPSPVCLWHYGTPWKIPDMPCKRTPESGLSEQLSVDQRNA